MKRKNSLVMMSYFLVLILMVTGCSGVVDDEVPEEPAEVVEEPQEPAPPIEEPEDPSPGPEDIVPETDFSNVENMSDFPELSDAQKEMLLKNRFFVSPSDQAQLFYVYELNEYEEVPNFITTDSVLHTYHIFYDYLLRTLENEKLLQLTENLTEEMLLKSIAVYEALDDGDLKTAQGKNIAYFSVAQQLLGNQLPEGIPEDLEAMALRELQLIETKAGFTDSEIFPFQMDYSQYVPRGHYTRSENLERYFQAMMWYGQVPFPLYERENVRNQEQTLQGILMTRMIWENEDLLDKWERIYDPTNFFVGSSDDLGIADYSLAIQEIYGKDPDYKDFANQSLLDSFYLRAEDFPEPKIVGRYISTDTPVDKQFRFMGQRYVFDSHIIQELVYPILRPIPSGLDVMAVLGSDRAKDIQLDKPENQQWEDYPVEMERLREEFSLYTEEGWKRNLYTGWMWTLEGLLEPADSSEPTFMKSQAWIDKDLNTALGSWAELKHDTVLYGKPSGAEMGGEEYVEILGYVEPNIDVYERLLWLTNQTRDSLNEWDLNLDEIDVKLERFQWLLQFLIDASQKQLEGVALTQEEHDRLKMYGGILEDLTSSFTGQGTRWHEITSETDKNMAVISDYHTIGRDGVMEAGVGPAYEIYVLAPIDGNLYLTRGAVMSFHEFVSQERLTDEKWQEMIKEGSNPPMPEWTDSFIER